MIVLFDVMIILLFFEIILWIVVFLMLRKNVLGSYISFFVLLGNMSEKFKEWFSFGFF